MSGFFDWLEKMQAQPAPPLRDKPDYDEEKMQSLSFVYRQAHQLYFNFLGVKKFSLRCGCYFMAIVSILTGIFEIMYARFDDDVIVKWYPYVLGICNISVGVPVFLGVEFRSRGLMWIGVFSAGVDFPVSIILPILDLTYNESTRWKTMLFPPLIMMIANCINAVVHFFLALSFENYLRHVDMNKKNDPVNEMNDETPLAGNEVTSNV